MLTAEGCRARRDRLFAAVPADVERIVVADREHLSYFADFYPSPFSFRSNDCGAALVVERSGRSTLVADSGARIFAESAHVDEVDLPVWYDGKRSASHREGRLVESALKRLSDGSTGVVGIETAAVPAGIDEGLRREKPDRPIVSIDDAIRRCKRSKFPDEVALLHRSMRAGEAGQRAALERTRGGMTELDVYLLVCDAVIREAGEPAIVYGDFVSGERTVAGGGLPTSRVIRPGEPFILDFSVVLRNYRCDFSNTFVVDGAPPDSLRRHYDACLDAMQAGESALKPGAYARDVDRAVRDCFRKQSLDGYFRHHTGHGIGVGHPEAPFLTSESDDLLVVGDVVTIEPGLYVAETGGVRIERNYLITQKGFEILSRHELTLEQPG
jgi:Xaa-Pro aminopeptidase